LQHPFYATPKAKETTEFGLRIKKSTIRNAGRGLFATKDFKKGDKIMKLKFQRLTKKQIDDRYDYYLCDNNGKCTEGLGSYSFTINARKGTYGDSACVRNAPSYANDKKNHANVKFAPDKGSRKTKVDVWFVTTKNIKAGQELFHSYGQLYWQSGPSVGASPHSLARVPVRAPNASGPLGKVVRATK
jgi:hypothetical protein